MLLLIFYNYLPLNIPCFKVFSALYHVPGRQCIVLVDIFLYNLLFVLIYPYSTRSWSNFDYSEHCLRFPSRCSFWNLYCQVFKCWKVVQLKSDDWTVKTTRPRQRKTRVGEFLTLSTIWSTIQTSRPGHNAEYGPSLGDIRKNKTIQ